MSKLLVATLSMIVPLCWAACDQLAQDIPCMYTQNIEADLASYNSLRNQVAYCKLQGYDTVSRSTSLGPSVFTSGLVKIGVGLSWAQFGSKSANSWMGLPEGAAACGMCIEVTKAENMPELGDELTTWTSGSNITVPFIAMVFDQCTDPICDESGYLDFDVYSENQPVEKGNPKGLEWHTVDCPVGDVHKLEYLFCSPYTCNAHDAEVARFGDVFSKYYFSLTIRNYRMPIMQVEIQANMSSDSWVTLHYSSGMGWTWTAAEFPVDDMEYFNVRVTSTNGQLIEEHIPIDEILESPSTVGYRGGVLYTGREQFNASHYDFNNQAA